MSCCGSKNEELRVVVIGHPAANKDEVIKMFQSYPECPELDGSPTETRVNMCCSPFKANRYPVKIDDLDLVLFDTPDLNAANCTDDDKKNLQEIQRCISKSARHVFLLVLDWGRNTTGKKELVDRITETFGEKIKENMVIVFKGDTSDDRLDVKSLKDQIKGMGDLNTLMLDCSERLVTFYGDDTSAVKKIKGHIKDIIIQGDEKCYTHEMMTAANKTGKCENLSLQAKIWLLIGLWLLIGVGGILIFFWKDLFEAVASDVATMVIGFLLIGLGSYWIYLQLVTVLEALGQQKDQLDSLIRADGTQNQMIGELGRRTDAVRGDLNGALGLIRNSSTDLEKLSARIGATGN